MENELNIPEGKIALIIVVDDCTEDAPVVLSKKYISKLISRTTTCDGSAVKGAPSTDATLYWTVKAQGLPIIALVSTPQER